MISITLNSKLVIEAYENLKERLTQIEIENAKTNLSFKKCKDIHNDWSKSELEEKHLKIINIIEDRIKMCEMSDTVTIDYNNCGCEPFQSCEKKTEWKNIPEGMKIGKEYWLIDPESRKGKGKKQKHTINLYPGECHENFSIPLMYAEIKPPKVP